jgi:molybdopterin/thiamine biosynthesis adenylyltransferase
MSGVGSDWLGRIDPTYRSAFQSATVMVVGVGSVGSFVAEQLARVGIEHVVLVDPDSVEDANLTRTIFLRDDVGKKKTEAARRRLFAINPNVRVLTEEMQYEEVPREMMRRYLNSSTIVVAATDNPRTQYAINRDTYYVGRPAVYIGVYPQAKAGEIVTCIPAKTPCFRCAVGTLRDTFEGSEEIRRESDYGTGRVPGVIALPCDIQHIATTAIRMILSLIANSHGATETDLALYAQRAVQRTLGVTLVNVEQNFWIFKELLAASPGQFAAQSIWLVPKFDDECPVCAEHADAADPFLAPVAEAANDTLLRETKRSDRA